ncbi:MAG: protease inhibitor I9 family protein, partial [Nocardioidaceae bacterium]
MAAATLVALGTHSAGAATSAGGPSSAAPVISGLDNPDRIAGAYIVVLDPGSVASQVAAAHASTFGIDVGHVYHSALSGYSAHMSESKARLIAAAAGVG